MTTTVAYRARALRVCGSRSTRSLSKAAGAFVGLPIARVAASRVYPCVTCTPEVVAEAVLGVDRSQHRALALATAERLAESRDAAAD